MNRNDFEKLMREKGNKIYYFLLKMLRNTEDAEDIMQETFLAFYQKVDNVKTGFYEAYLFRTAYNKALNKIKKRKKGYEVKEENLDQLEISLIKENNSEKRNYGFVKNLIENLPKNQKAALILQFYNKKSYKEIAEIMQTSTSAVDALLVRAKRKLKKMIVATKNQKKGVNYEML